MAAILLEHYLNMGKQYSLDTESGVATEQPRATGQNCAGYGLFRTAGLLRNRRKFFVALYVDRGTMMMRIGDRTFDWEDATLLVKRESIAPFVKRFSVWQGNQVVLSFPYIYTNILGTFPDDPGGDFFTFIEEKTRTRSNIQEFIAIWTLVSQGRDIQTQEFWDEVKRYISDGKLGN